MADMHRDEEDEEDKGKPTNGPSSSSSSFPSQCVHGLVSIFLCYVASQLWSGDLGAPPGSEASHGALLAVASSLAFDNAVLALGALLGPGVALDRLSRVRYFLYVLSMPMLVSVVVDVAHRGGVVWLDAVAHTTTWMLSYGIIGIFVSREVLAILKPPIPHPIPLTRDNLSASAFGDCLASNALVLGGRFVLKREGPILRYEPSPRRANDAAAAGLAVLASLGLGTLVWSSTGRGMLALGATFMIGAQMLRGVGAPPVANHVGEALWVACLAAASSSYRE